MTIKNLIVSVGLAALLGGCATSNSEVTQDSPVDSHVNSYASNTRYDSVSKRFDRLRELEPSYGGASASMSGYVMGDMTDVSLRIIAGIYSGTVKVISDGNRGFSSKGTYWQEANPEAIERAYKEADVNSDKIITREEAEKLTLQVFRQYATEAGFPKIDEGIDKEGNLHKKVHDKL